VDPLSHGETFHRRNRPRPARRHLRGGRSGRPEWRHTARAEALLFRGRRYADRPPKRPSWAPLRSRERSRGRERLRPPPRHIGARRGRCCARRRHGQLGYPSRDECRDRGAMPRKIRKHVSGRRAARTRNALRSAPPARQSELARASAATRAYEVSESGGLKYRGARQAGLGTAALQGSSSQPSELPLDRSITLPLRANFPRMEQWRERGPVGGPDAGPIAPRGRLLTVRDR
jgi:hypothetical protein